MTSSNELRLSNETESIYNKLLIFKQRYQECSKKLLSQEATSASVNIELSHTKMECSRLREELSMKQSSIIKYQQMLRELVEVEDRYCKLLQEKKNTDEQLAAEKKLRLDMEKRHDDEKKEIRNSWEEQFRAIEAKAELKGDVLITESSQALEAKNKEILNLKQELYESTKKYEEEIVKLKQSLKRSQDLRADGGKVLCNSNQVSSKLDVEKGRTEFSELEYDKDGRLQSSSQMGSCKEVRSSTNGPQSSFNTSPPLPSKTHLSSPSIASSTSQTPLQVFRIPMKKSKVSITRCKRKLYTRSDDTL